MKNYQTNDIALAVTLYLYGYKLVDIIPRGDRINHASFEFEGVDDAFLNDYDMDKLVVEPKAFSFKTRWLTGVAQRRCSGK